MLDAAVRLAGEELAQWLEAPVLLLGIARWCLGSGGMPQCPVTVWHSWHYWRCVWTRLDVRAEENRD